MTEQEFLQISVYMKQNYGIELKDKKEIVRGRILYIKTVGVALMIL